MSSEQTRDQLIDEIKNKYISEAANCTPGIGIGYVHESHSEEYPTWPDSISDEVKTKFQDFSKNSFKSIKDQIANKQILALEEDTRGVTAQFLGVGGILFDDGHDFILTDPYFTRPEWSGAFGALLPGGGKIAPDKQLVTKFLEHSMKQYDSGRSFPEVIFCTHGHFDHALDIGCVAQVIYEKNGKYPMVFASRSVLNVCIAYLLTKKHYDKIADCLEPIVFWRDNELSDAIHDYWIKNYKAKEQHDYNEDEDEMKLNKFGAALDFSHLSSILRDGNFGDRGIDMLRKEHELEQLAVLLRVGSDFDPEKKFLFEIENEQGVKEKKTIPEVLEPLRHLLDSFYYEFNFFPIDGWNYENVSSGDRQFSEFEVVKLLGKNSSSDLNLKPILVEKPLNVYLKSFVKFKAFEMKTLKGFHINIPNFSCRGTNPIPIPLKQYTSDMNTGVLFNILVEHPEIKKRKGEPVGKIFAQGSANFHRGQMKNIYEKSDVSKTPVIVSNVIMGAPGISLGSGIMAGKPGRDSDGRKEFYKEIVINGQATQIYFHHWDDFSVCFEPEGAYGNHFKPMGWFNNLSLKHLVEGIPIAGRLLQMTRATELLFHSDTSMVINQFQEEMKKPITEDEDYQLWEEYEENAEKWLLDGGNSEDQPQRPNVPRPASNRVYLDPVYEDAKIRWDALKEENKKSSEYAHFHPDLARKFEFLPLFRRIKI